MTVKLENVSKKYCKSLRRSFTYGLRDSVGSVFGNKERPDLRPGEFWSLREVSFEVSPGERVGILGRNGAGKSTLGKVISGILLPDSGSVSVDGSIDQLIELTSGFHPSLSGRENARISAMIKGMSPQEFLSEIDRIIDFTELGDFIDSPVKFYSSGMKARLGFAVATMLKPDVLIVDEALAVGDLNFRLKCYNFLGEYLADTSLLLVSHSMSQLRRFCSRGIVLDKGRMLFDGAIQPAIDTYEQINDEQATTNTSESVNNEDIQFRLLADGRSIADREDVAYGAKLRLSLKSSTEFPEGSSVTIALDDAARQHVAEWNSLRSDFTLSTKALSCEIDLGHAYLNPGLYRIYVWVIGPDGFSLLVYTENLIFRVVGEMHGLAALQPKTLWESTTPGLNEKHW